VIAVDGLVPLARGGTAELFAAWAGGVRVVVKLARDDRAGAGAALAAEAGVIEQLGPALAPRLLGRTRIRDRDALVLEHIALPTLRAAPPAPGDREAAAAAICATVARVHAAGIVHADLTPDNILIDVRSGAVRLIDFGTSAAIGGVLAPLATVGYAAPERMVAGCRADPAVDVYALGVLCYELVTGGAPFEGALGERRIAHAARRIPRASERVAVAPAVDEIIARAMAKLPAHRTTDAAAMAAALGAGRGAKAPAPPTAARDAPTRTPSRPALLVGFRWAAGAAAIRDAVAGAGGVLAYSEAERHVAVVWRGDAAAEAERLAAALAGAGALEIDVVEAKVQVGTTGVPRGAAIVELGRRPSRTDRSRPERSDAPHGEGRPLAGSPPPGPLVGRAAPLQAIASAARTVAAGGTALITIWGAPGLGKSRVAGAAIDALRDAGFALLEARAPTALALVALVGLDDDDRDSDAIDRAALRAATGRGAIAGSAAEPLAAAPGALRQAAARALAHALAAGDRPRAVIVDDAHAADPIVLDALELATLDPAGRLLVIALARPALATTRPRWGRRAAIAEVITLAPLDRDDGRALIRALLPAVAAVPSAALDRLVERCGGVPLYVTELVGALQRADRARGATTTGTRGALPTDLVELPAELGIVAWAVADELSGLSPATTAAAEALAVGGDVRAADIPALFPALDRAGVRIELDPGVAIADLLAAGLIVERAGVLGLRHDLVRDAIAQRTNRARRTAIHHAWLALATTPAERARHAEGAGDPATAATAWAAAARDALARHDDLAAELALGRAIACTAPGEVTAELLRQRGSARARLGRHDAAAGDFAAARERAYAASDRGAAIDVLLDEATALDWSLHHARSAARVAEATALATEDEPALRRARLAMAAGRTAWRAGDAAHAIGPCRQAIALADAVGADGYETAIAGRLMLGFVLGGRGEIAEAADILDQAQALAAARGDLMHVAAARCNRYPVHAARGDAAGLRADLAAFAAAGRELGIAVTEYRGALYQALVALWCGDDAGALVLALAARRIEEADPALCPRPCAALVLAELAARRDDVAATTSWCELAARHAAGAPIDAVVREGLLTWAAGALTLATATALAQRALALGESEAAFQVLELTARTAARRGDPGAAAAAHHAARAVPNLPRFLTHPLHPGPGERSESDPLHLAPEIALP
jgi:eukaryotic-like serine/threonine-protein kinase